MFGTLYVLRMLRNSLHGGPLHAGAACSVACGSGSGPHILQGTQQLRGKLNATFDYLGNDFNETACECSPGVRSDRWLPA
jgi:hypothetical protein